MKTLLCLVSLTLLLVTSSLLSAVTIGQIDDFESNIAGWKVGGGPGANGPQVISVNGIDGAFLNYTTDNANTGGRFLIINASQWSGDYLAAGVSGISAVAKNEGNVELNMRLLLEGSGGGFLSRVARTLPVGSDWQSVFFPISASELTGGDDLTKTLASVAQVRIFHNPSPAFPGPFADASMSIDNIRAVPEPAAHTMLVGILGCLAIVRSRFIKQRPSKRDR